MRIDSNDAASRTRPLAAAPKPSRPFGEVLGDRRPAEAPQGRSPAPKTATLSGPPGAAARDFGAPVAGVAQPASGLDPDMGEVRAVAPEPQGRSHAFGFDALGVLSAFGVVDAAAAAVVSPLGEAQGADVAVCDPHPGDRAPVEPAHAPERPTAASTLRAPDGPGRPDLESGADLAGSAGGGIVGPRLAVEPSDGESGDLAPGRTAPRTLRARAGAVGPPVSLLVAEQDGALSLVAAAPLSGPEAARLTREVDELARRFGTQVAEFQLNGEVAAHSATPQGGSHGRRAR